MNDNELIYFVPTTSCALHLFALHAVDFTLSNCKMNKDGATFYLTNLHLIVAFLFLFFFFNILGYKSSEYELLCANCFVPNSKI